MASWFPVMPASELRDDEMRAIDVAGRDILFVRQDGGFYAIDNTCTHAWGLLDQGVLMGYEVKCPLHRGRFDIRTGAPTERPCTVPVASYPTKIDEAGVVHVELAELKG
jgi:naphthalene 1,2-dioxygenase ferredoxin component